MEEADQGFEKQEDGDVCVKKTLCEPVVALCLAGNTIILLYSNQYKPICPLSKKKKMVFA